MRLLFIYFYETKGTFKEGTIISLSKKYSVNYNGDFNFTLTKNDSFQDNFYGDNIDIGAVIGENGTGKSILINSLRDGSNDYSLAVYEKEDGEFFYEGSFKEEISIEGSDIEPLDNTSFVYYSPIMDMFDFEKEYLVDVSDKQMLLEAGGSSLKETLIAKEQYDLGIFLRIRNKIKNNVIKVQLRLIPDRDFFNVIMLGFPRENILYECMQKATEQDSKLYKIFIEKINSTLHKDMKIIILNKKLDSLDEIFFIKNKSLINKYLKILSSKYSTLSDLTFKENNDFHQIEEIKLLKKHTGLSISIEDFNFSEEEINGMMKTLDIKYIDSCMQENFKNFFNLFCFTMEEISQFINYFFNYCKLDFHVLSSLLFILLFKDKEFNDYQKIQIYVLSTLLDSVKNSMFFTNLDDLLELSLLDLIDLLSLELEKENQILYKKFIEKLSIDCFLEIDDIIEIYNIIVDNSLVPFTYELNPPLSSGQKAILFIFARIDNAIKNIESKNITILLDEADLKLHLEWQRQFINDLVEFLKSYPDKNFYVLYSTHSPMILSDITDDRIVFLKKEGDYSIDKPINETKSTFGANIYDLYHDSFFMDRYMGEFAFNKINDVINMVNLYKIVMELNGDEKQERLKDYERIYNFDKLFQSYALYYPEAKIDSENLYEKQEEIKSNIESQKEHLKATAKFIGEPLLRNKLEDDLNSIGREFDIDKVVEKLQGLSQQEIKEELSKYSESIQMKILKKLFASEYNHDKS